MPSQTSRTMNPRTLLAAVLLAACTAALLAPARAQSSAIPSAQAGASSTRSAPAVAGEHWEFGAVLDLGYTSRALALGSRDKGLQLGHSDLNAGGPLGRHLRAQLSAALATHDGELERGLEEAWIETRTLPAGLQVRAGRFASQVGYLNAQHLHADDYTERPLLYRALLGGHWTDDGVRLNWTAPTPFFLMVGAEALRGRRLVHETADRPGRIGATTVVAKLGADAGRSHSWQLGLSHIHNRREAAVEEEHAEAEGEAHHHHHEAHGARFSGRRTLMLDATWKWAPGGNNRAEQLRVSVEAARVTGLNRHASAQDHHLATALSIVWRLHPSWEVGARMDSLRVRIPHEDHFDDGRLRETALMLAWKPSHRQSVRLQWSAQRRAVGFEDTTRRALQLQYGVAFGAHGTHAY